MFISVANFDVTKDMIQNSIRSSNRPPTDSSLEMLLQQSSIYPLLPNIVNSDENDKIEKVISVDHRKYKNFNLITTPDLVITTSQMNPFIKKISNTIFLNPGSIYRGNNLGYYARIISYPPSVKLFFKLLKILELYWL